MENFKSTKFVLTVMVVILSYVLVLVGKLPSDTWVQMAVAAAGIYGAANVAADFANKR